MEDADTCTKTTKVSLVDGTEMQSTDTVEDNNDGCCVAGIDSENDQLIRACEINETYTWAEESCSLTVDALHPENGSSHELSHADNILISECCREAD